jgi:hypothetical protein
MLSSISLLLASSVVATPAKPALLEPFLSVAPASCVVGQKLMLTVGVRNAGEQPGWLDGRIADRAHLYVQVFDVAGAQVHYPGWNTKVRLSSPEREDFIRLKPGFSLMRPESGFGQVVLDKPGRYKVELRFSHGASAIYAKEFKIPLAELSGPAAKQILVAERAQP